MFLEKYVFKRIVPLLPKVKEHLPRFHSGRTIMAFKTSAELLVVLSCAAIIGVWADCLNGRSRTVEERTRNVPVIVKGIVVARGHTDNRFTVRVGKILKGGNESIAGTQIDIRILENTESSSMASGTSRTGQASDATTDIAMQTTHNGEDSYGVREEVTTVTSNVVSQTSSNSIATTREPVTDAALQTTIAVQHTTPEVTCVEDVVLLSRYIFFLRPLEDSKVFFEVTEDVLPQTRQNLRRVRQEVKDEQDEFGVLVNNTLPEDDHRGQCTDPIYEKHFCLNGGTCAVWRNLNKYFCICYYPYHGERCQEVDPALNKNERPVNVGVNDTTLAIAVIMSALLLITVICVIAYIKYKNSVWRERKREVEKRVQFLQERHPPSMPSRRSSPGGGSLNLKQNSANNASEGASHIIVFQDADGKHSRRASLNSNQYRLLAELERTRDEEART